MNDRVTRGPLILRRWITAIIIVGLGVGASRAYVNSQRGPADAFVAAQAIEAIQLAGAEPDAAGQKTMSVDDVVLLMSVYVDSDSATRLPLTPEVKRAWTALRVSDEIARRAAAGDSTPTVASIPGASELLGDAPELAADVTLEGGTARFIDADGELHAEIRKLALRDANRAMGILTGLYPRLWDMVSVPPTADSQ